MTHFLSVHARDDKYSMSMQYPIASFQTNFTQINQIEEQGYYNLVSPQNSGWTTSSSSQDWYQQHRQFVLSHVVCVPLQGKIIKITPEDIHLVNRICGDNPHKDKDALRIQLSQSSAFNYAQHFFNGDNLLHAFTPDIFIDPAHFKKVSAADYRTKRLQDAAKDAVHDRHKREKGSLESKQKAEANAAKKLSKSEKKKVDNRHKQELTALENKQKEETKHPLGIKNKTVEKSSVASPGQQKATSQILQSKILVQDLENLRVQNQLAKSDDSSFQKVMEHRSKAIGNSIKNSTLTVQSIKINPQTTGFLQAEGIDTQQFARIEGLPIQHQLTQELVEVLNGVADFAMQHRHELYQTHLTKYCAHLASMTQQSNMQGALQQAIDGANCCHGIQHYLIGMVSGIEQKYQQFQTALDYFDTVLDQYRNFIALHAVQGRIFTHGLEAIITAGMVAAPTTTVVATGIMIGATAYTMAPLCAQAMIDTISFGGACITGNWNKVTSDLDSFGKFISKEETVARMAEFAGGAAIPTPNLSNLVEQILSLRPVITSVQNASGEMVQSLYLMTKNQLKKVWQQSAELLQLPEFVNFNATYKKICGINFFDILPKSPLVRHSLGDGWNPVLAGMEAGLLSSGEQVALTSLFTQSQESLVGDVVKSGVSQVGSQLVQNILPTDFLTTEVGKNMLEIMTKPYEQTILNNVAKEYNKLIANQAPQETIHTFCRCHELSIVPKEVSADIERLHAIFKDKYLGLPEFSSENKYLTMQMRHIFYPSLQPEFDTNYQEITKFVLNGFHHDEFGFLEKSGILQWQNKNYGLAEFGAEECFIADSDWGQGIICNNKKTFFPSHWSREKVTQIIFEAAQNRIEDITDPRQKNQRKYLCKGFNNILIEISINLKNVIVSAYPSKKNFRI